MLGVARTGAKTTSKCLVFFGAEYVQQRTVLVDCVDATTPEEINAEQSFVASLQ